MDQNGALSRDQLERQLAMVDLLSAMYPDQVALSGEDSATLNHLRDWLDSKLAAPKAVPLSVTLTINIHIDEDVDKTIELAISVHLRMASADFEEATLVTYNVRQPSWLSKSQVAEIAALMPKDDVLSAIEYLGQEVTSPRDSAPILHETTNMTEQALVRAWFYFPSISTRSKRDDIVRHSTSYDLSGFLLAGKPGVLCLEGTSRSIDEYMKFIKTESWGDIPSHQKKVSERYREVLNITRVFSGMQEITDAPFMGEKNGQRGNRTDMQTLQIWLEGKRLGEAFQKVIF